MRKNQIKRNVEREWSKGRLKIRYGFCLNDVHVTLNLIEIVREVAEIQLRRYMITLSNDWRGKCYLIAI